MLNLIPYLKDTEIKLIIHIKFISLRQGNKINNQFFNFLSAPYAVLALIIYCFIARGVLMPSITIMPFLLVAK
jgi:hypothetical protein